MKMKNWKIVIGIIIVIIIGIAIIFMIKTQKDIPTNQTMPNTKGTLGEKPNNVIEEVEEEDENRSIDKVTMTIKEGTLTPKGATVIIKDENENPYYHGDWYIIEKYENGQWKGADPVDENYIDDKLPIISEIRYEFDINWTEVYGTLGKGKYRLIKSVNENEGNEQKYFWVEFTID